MKKYLFAIMIITALLAMNAASEAAEIFNSWELPPEDGAYVSDEYYEYHGAEIDIILDDSVLDYTNIIREADGDDEIETFLAVFGATEIGEGLGLVTLTGPVQMRHENRLLSSTGLFDAEIISMQLSGDGLMIRESPTLASNGQTGISDIGGGLYEIDSFFDVFTELSVDGGQTWIASDYGTRMYLVPEPATVILFSLGGLALLRRRKA